MNSKREGMRVALNLSLNRQLSCAWKGRFGIPPKSALTWRLLRLLVVVADPAPGNPLAVDVLLASARKRVRRIGVGICGAVRDERGAHRVRSLATPILPVTTTAPVVVQVEGSSRHREDPLSGQAAAVVAVAAHDEQSETLGGRRQALGELELDGLPINLRVQVDVPSRDFETLLDGLLAGSAFGLHLKGVAEVGQTEVCGDGRHDRSPSGYWG